MSAVGCGGLVPRHCRLTSRNGGRVGGPPFFVLRRFLGQADRRCQPLPISSMHLKTEIARCVFQWLAFPHPHPCNFSGQHSPADIASFRRAVRKEPEFVVQICLTIGQGRDPERTAIIARPSAPEAVPAPFCSPPAAHEECGRTERRPLRDFLGDVVLSFGHWAKGL